MSPETKKLVEKSNELARTVKELQEEIGRAIADGTYSEDLRSRGLRAHIAWMEGVGFLKNRMAEEAGLITSTGSRGLALKGLLWY